MRSFFSKISVYLFLFLSIGGPFSLAADKKKDPIIPLAEFNQLLQYYVDSITELSPLWNQRASGPKKVYLTGGVLRGAIHDLYRNIEHYRMQSAANSHPSYPLIVPSAGQLLLQQWSDMDLVAPPALKNWVQSHLVEPWDILSSQFAADSQATGGSTLEKVRVNPWEVVDPFNAIEDYLQGNLVFEPGPALNQGELVGNTRLAQALRFLRISANLPEVKITPKSWENLRKIKDQEWNTICRGTNTDYWILKALKKLYHAANKSPSRVIQLLKDADLLTLLAKHHFSLTPDESHYSPLSNKPLIQGRLFPLNMEEKMATAQVLGRNTQERIQFLQLINPVNPQEQLALDQRIKALQQLRLPFGGENRLHGNQGAGGVQVLVNGVPVQIQPQAQAGVQILPDGAAQFNVPIPVDAHGRPQCIQLIVNVGIGLGK